MTAKPPSPFHRLTDGLQLHYPLTFPLSSGLASHLTAADFALMLAHINASVLLGPAHTVTLSALPLLLCLAFIGFIIAAALPTTVWVWVMMLLCFTLLPQFWIAESSFNAMRLGRLAATVSVCNSCSWMTAAGVEMALLPTRGARRWKQDLHEIVFMTSRG